MQTIAPPAAPQEDGSLLVRQPTNATRFDFGNQRLFACVDGSGSLSAFNLAEGIRVLSSHSLTIQVNGRSLVWQNAVVFARLFRLSAQSDDLAITLTITCDETNAAILWHWEFRNTSEKPATVNIRHRFQFDMHHPTYQRASLTGLFQRALTGQPGKMLLGPRRWKIENYFGEKIKKPPKVIQTPIQVDGKQFKACRDGVAAQVLCIPPPQTLDDSNGLAEQTLSIPARGTIYAENLLTCEEHALLPQEILSGAQRHAAGISAQLRGANALQRSQLAACLTTAESMFKRLPSGFSGFWAGPGYAYPPRIYFRDSYWTVQPLLKSHPHWVRTHILNLARGVQPNGACPSGVIDPAAVRNPLQPGALSWMPNHFDSPAYLILLVNDYLQSGGDEKILNEEINGRGLLEHLQACGNYLFSQDTDQDGLPEKGQNPNDWADNVLRYPWVTYDCALIYGAWMALARLDTPHAVEWQARAATLKAAANQHLWLAKKGWFADYARPDFKEEHLALDTLTAVRFGLANPEQSQQMLDAVEKNLLSVNNPHQPYSNWGVLCCYPSYRNSQDVFAKSAYPYRYHNGSEWPYLSALAALLLRQFGFQAQTWQYALTRWWQYSLDQGWLTPVEFHSPAYPPGAFLQGWSALAALVILENH
jgi:hypothetical protein